MPLSLWIWDPCSVKGTSVVCRDWTANWWLRCSLLFFWPCDRTQRGLSFRKGFGSMCLWIQCANFQEICQLSNSIISTLLKDIHLLFATLKESQFDSDFVLDFERAFICQQWVWGGRGIAGAHNRQHHLMWEGDPQSVPWTRSQWITRSPKTGGEPVSTHQGGGVRLLAHVNRSGWGQMQEKVVICKRNKPGTQVKTWCDLKATLQVLHWSKRSSFEDWFTKVLLGNTCRMVHYSAARRKVHTGVRMRSLA